MPQRLAHYLDDPRWLMANPVLRAGGPDRSFAAADWTPRQKTDPHGRQQLLSSAFALAVTRLTGARPDLLEIKERARRIVALADRSPRFGEWAAKQMITDPSRSVDESIGLAELLVDFVETEISPPPEASGDSGIRLEEPPLLLASDGYLRLRNRRPYPGDQRLSLEGMLNMFPGQDVTVRVSGSREPAHSERTEA